MFPLNKQTKSRRNGVEVKGEKDRLEIAECDYFGSSVDYPARGRPTQLTKPLEIADCAAWKQVAYHQPSPLGSKGRSQQVPLTGQMPQHAPNLWPPA